MPLHEINLATRSGKPISEIHFPLPGTLYLTDSISLVFDDYQEQCLILSTCCEHIPKN